MLINLIYKGKDIAVSSSKTDTWIEGSHRIKSRKDMKAILWLIRDKSPLDFMIWHRTLKSQIREWRAHNLLFALGYKRDQTADVDLDVVTRKTEVLYFILSLFYWRF